MAVPENLLQMGRANFRRFIETVPLIPPKEIFAKLGALGYHGQEGPRRALSLMAYRHVRRLKRIYLEGVSRDDVPVKSNYLLVGPTGCGKTYIVELLFREILHLPSVVIDITTYSETGYVGQDVCTILTRLIHCADNDPLIASVGVVCLDEFDKIATGQNNAIFAGAGTTKDVTGLGVQRELLKMLEGGEVVVPMELGHSSYSERLLMPTADVAFIACGAFSGFHSIVRMRGGGQTVGFGRQISARAIDGIAVSLSPEEVESTANFQAYGFLPELIARFTRTVPFLALDEGTLLAILEDNVVGRFVKEFAEEGFTLVVSQAVLLRIVRDSLKKETGARGLSSLLTRYLEDAAYECFASEQKGTVDVDLEEGHMTVRMDKGPARVIG